MTKRTFVMRAPVEVMQYADAATGAAIVLWLNQHNRAATLTPLGIVFREKRAVNTQVIALTDYVIYKKHLDDFTVVNEELFGVFYQEVSS